MSLPGATCESRGCHGEGRARWARDESRFAALAEDHAAEGRCGRDLTVFRQLGRQTEERHAPAEWHDRGAGHHDKATRPGGQRARRRPLGATARGALEVISSARTHQHARSNGKVRDRMPPPRAHHRRFRLWRGQSMGKRWPVISARGGNSHSAGLLTDD